MCGDSLLLVDGTFCSWQALHQRARVPVWVFPSREAAWSYILTYGVPMRDELVPVEVGVPDDKRQELLWPLKAHEVDAPGKHKVPDPQKRRPSRDPMFIKRKRKAIKP